MRKRKNTSCYTSNKKGGDLVTTNQINQVEEDKDKQEYIYWNGSYTNFNVIPQPVIIQDIRSQALILEPRKYEMYVESFTFDTTDNPIFTALCNQGINDVVEVQNNQPLSNSYTNFPNHASNISTSVGNQYSASNTITITQLRWYNVVATSIGNVVLKLWDQFGNQLGPSLNVGAAGNTTWVTLQFPDPITIMANNSFTVSADTIQPLVYYNSSYSFGSVGIININNGVFGTYLQRPTTTSTNLYTLDFTYSYYPLNTYNFWGSSVANFSSPGDTNYYDTGQQFNILQPVTITQLRFYNWAAAATWDHISIYNTKTHQKIASIAIGIPVTGWNYYTLTTPIYAPALSSYIVVYGADNIQYSPAVTYPLFSQDLRVAVVASWEASTRNVFPTGSTTVTFAVDFVYTDALTIDTLNYYVSFQWFANGAYNYASTFLTMGPSVNPYNAPTTLDKTNSVNYAPYYGIFTFEQFLQIVNAALAQAYLNLLNLSGYPTTDNSPPYCLLNPDTGILSLVLPVSLITNNVQLVIENDLMDILNLPYTQILENNSIAPIPNLSHLIVFNYQYYTQASQNYLSATNGNVQCQLTGTTATSFQTGTPYWTFPAFYLCTDHDYRALWYDTYQIILTSNLASPEAYSSFMTKNNSNNSTDNILAAFTVDLQGSQVLAGQITYTPYIKKWISVYVSDPIMSITVNFWYQDSVGNKYRVTQTKDKIAKCRIVFRKIQ